MSRLFDTDGGRRTAEAARNAQAETRRRAREADEALKDYKENDAASVKLRNSLAAVQSVAPIRYQEYRQRGSRWMIEHSQVGEDYIFQLHPLKPPVVDWKEVLALAIAAMDVIFPRSLKIQYVPPNQKYKLQFYTIKVNGLIGLPGWKGGVERGLSSLSSMEVWGRTTAP